MGVHAKNRGEKITKKEKKITTSATAAPLFAPLIGFWGEKKKTKKYKRGDKKPPNPREKRPSISHDTQAPASRTLKISKMIIEKS